MISSLLPDLLKEISKYLTPKSGLAFSQCCKQTFFNLGTQRETWKSQLTPWKDLPIPQLLAREFAKELLAMEPESIRISYTASCNLTSLDKELIIDKGRISFCNLLSCDHQTCKLKDFVLSCESYSALDILTFVLSTKPFGVRFDLTSFKSENSRLSYAGWYRSGLVQTYNYDNTVHYLETHGYQSFVENLNDKWERALKRSFTRRWLPRRLRSCRKDISDYITDSLRRLRCERHFCKTDCRWWICLSKWETKNRPNKDHDFIGFVLSNDKLKEFANMPYCWSYRSGEFTEHPSFAL